MTTPRPSPPTPTPALPTSRPATAEPPTAGEVVGHCRTASTLTPDELADRAAALLDAGFRVALIAGHDDSGHHHSPHHGHDGRGGALRAVYLFTAIAPDRRVELHVPLDPDRPQVPSLAGLSFPAGRFEREMRDLFGIVPVDHPLPRRLVRHFHWPRGWYPMLAAAGDPPAFGDHDGPYPFRIVEGPGVYEIPVGPVHAGMIEPGHFRFSVVGETILKFKARLWFVHRGIEKLFQGRTPQHALELAERVSGDTSVGHALAFCQAVEDTRSVVISDDAQRRRGNPAGARTALQPHHRHRRAVQRRRALRPQRPRRAHPRTTTAHQRPGHRTSTAPRCRLSRRRRASTSCPTPPG